MNHTLDPSGDGAYGALDLRERIGYWLRQNRTLPHDETAEWWETWSRVVSAEPDLARRALASQGLGPLAPLGESDTIVPLDHSDAEWAALRVAPLAGRPSPVKTIRITLERLETRMGTATGPVAAGCLSWLMERLGGSSEIQEPVTASEMLGRITDQLLRPSSPLERRMHSVLVRRWAAQVLELARRLDGDSRWLEALSHSPVSVRALESIEFGWSDPHRGGRTVAFLRFSGGGRLVYKPRSLAPDQQFWNFIQSVTEGDATLRFRRPWILERHRYAWQEFVPARECDSERDVAVFYRRLGAIMAGIWLLRGADIHAENLIAHGPYPVPVDLEALFHNHIGELDRPFTILDTALLPFWVSDGNVTIESGGILAQQTGTLFGRGDVASSSPEAVEAGAPAATPRSANVPLLDSEEVDPLRYADPLVEGFERFARLCISRADSLLSESGQLRAFAELPTRFLLRPTRAYALILKGSGRRQALRDGLVQDCFLDRLWLAAARDRRFDEWIPHEKSALRWRDVPVFSSRPSSTEAVACGGATIPEAFGTPSLELVSERIRTLDDRAVIEETVALRTALALRGSPAILEPLAVTPVVGREGAEDADAVLLSAVRRSVDALQSTCPLDMPEAMVNIVQDGAYQWRIAHMPRRLYDGLSGVCMFLYAAGRRLGLPALRQKACALREWDSTRTGPAKTYGAVLGDSSQAYVDLVMGSWERNSGLIERGVQTLKRQITENVEHASSADVMGGLAGDLLLLLRGFQASNDEELLALALKTTKKLDQFADSRGGGWTGHAHRATFTGFGHGAAGICFALHQLVSLTGDSHCARMLRSGMSYLEQRRAHTPGTWLPVGVSGEQYTDVGGINGWCHGPAGIALTYSVTHPGGEALKAAIQSLVSAPNGDDSFCHGAMGRADIALAVASATGDMGLAQWGRDVTLARATAFISGEGLRPGSPTGLPTPDLFLGHGSLGYQCLRVLDPADIPSVLTLELPKVEPVP